MSNKKLYKILEINEDSSEQQIRSAWKKLTMKYHPDRLKTPEDKKMGQEKIKEINAAYEVLGDPEKKEKYDKYGDDFLKGDFQDFDGLGDFGPMFGNFFGHGHKQKKEANVQPIQTELQVTLVDLFYGKVMEKEINRIILCKICDGTGSADKKYVNCDKCNGQGKVIKLVQMGPGMQSQSVVHCTSCRGTGKMGSPINKCKKCNGNPQSFETVKIKVNVEAGAKNEKVITINNMGNEYLAKPGKIEKGPVLVILLEQEHQIFKRGFTLNNKQNMADLLMMIDINLVESLCGFSKEIKYIDDSILYLCETDIIKDGEVKKIPNKGMPYESNKYKNGDLYIKYNVKMPDNISMEIKNKIAELFNYQGISKPSECVIEVNTVKVNENDNNYDSDEDDVNRNPHGIPGFRPGSGPGQGGVQCVHF